MTLQPGWFQFTDGGSYAGEVDLDRTANGLGVARGRTGQEFAGSWNCGFEQTGVCRSSSGHLRYEGQWLGGKRNGFGVETRDGWTYRGEWINGFKGRYGVRQSLRSSAKFEGTWTNGLQDGYGVEKYADGGVYQGQWLNGLRHGYGIRQSATYAEAVRSHDQFRVRFSGHQSPPCSTENFELRSILGSRDERIEVGGGFVLSEDVAFDGSRRKFWTSVSRLGGATTGFSRTLLGGLRKKGRRRRSAEGVIDEGQTQENYQFNVGNRSSGYSTQVPGEEDTWSVCNRARVLENQLTENYTGEWRQDRRCGFGVCQRSDGLKYEGEWANNKKSGYGRTTLPDGSRLEGKYRNNGLVSSVSKSGRGTKFLSMSLGEKVENSVKDAQLAAENAKQKAEISSIRAVTAQEKAEVSTSIALDAVRNAEMAQHKTSELNQQNAQQGENLKLHRIDEDSFLMEYDTASVAMTTTGATRKSKVALSALQGQGHTVQDFDADNARKSVPSKWFSFPRRKPKITEDIRTDTRLLESGNRQYLPPESRKTEVGVEPGFDEHLSGMTVSSHLGSGGHGLELGRMKQQMVPRMHASLAPIDEKLIGEKIRRELLEAIEPKNAMHPRRNSLPSIIKSPILPVTPSPLFPAPPPPVTHVTPHKPEHLGVQPTSPSTPPRIPHNETYVIEKGIRKRVKYTYEDVEQGQRSPSGAIKKVAATPSLKAAQGAMEKLIMSTMVTGFALSQSTPLRDWTSDDDRKDFRKMYVLESPGLNRKTKTGSTSDVSSIRLSEMMSREQVYVMSQRRREEIIVRRAEEERRRTSGEIVISVSGLLDCRVFPVLILVIAIASVVFMVHHFGLISASSSPH